MTIIEKLKRAYYEKIGRHQRPQRCLCGGRVHTFHFGWYEGDVGYETHCTKCRELYAED